MLTTSEKNTCLMIAKGEIKEKDLRKTLTSEQKKWIEIYKEIIDVRKKDKLEDLVNSMSVE